MIILIITQGFIQLLVSYFPKKACFEKTKLCSFIFIQNRNTSTNTNRMEDNKDTAFFGKF